MENLVNNLNTCKDCEKTLIIDDNKMENNHNTEEINDIAKKMGYCWCNTCLSWKEQDIEKLKKTFKHTDNGTKHYHNENDDLFKLLLRKGVYPYDYMDSFDKFEEKELTDKKHFFNKLTNEDIKEEDYKHAQNVYKKINMTNMGDYHDLYLLTPMPNPKSPIWGEFSCISIIRKIMIIMQT